MPDYPAIRDALLTVVNLLRQHITMSGDPGLNGVPIDLRAPRELELANVATAVSLWLHRVESQPDLLNQLPPRPDDGHELHLRTSVELCVHVTPLHPDAATRLLLLGRVAQILTDHRRLHGADLVGSLAGTATVLLLGMEPLGAYELNLLWGSQQTYMRAGVALRVQGVSVDSHLPPTMSPRVMMTTAAADQIVGSSP